MLIEWLLTKAADTETQRGTSKSAQDAHSVSREAGSRHPEAYLRCDCGYEGTVSRDNMDSQLPGRQKSGSVNLECPDCERHLQYDHSTGKIKTKKGIWGLLFGMFS
jgi:hypothetical protein